MNIEITCLKADSSKHQGARMSASDYDYEVEKYETYFGDAKNVINTMETCNVCGGKIQNNYLSDYKNLCIKEQKSCIECGSNNDKKIHQLC